MTRMIAALGFVVLAAAPSGSEDAGLRLRVTNPLDAARPLGEGSARGQHEAADSARRRDRRVAICRHCFWRRRGDAKKAHDKRESENF